MPREIYSILKRRSKGISVIKQYLDNTLLKRERSKDSKSVIMRRLSQNTRRTP
jgi:hypothetical protein